MTDPRRLVDGDGEPLERQLLGSARVDGPSELRRHALMRNLGLAVPPLGGSAQGVEQVATGGGAAGGSAAAGGGASGSAGSAAVTAQLSGTKLVLVALGMSALTTLGVVALRDSDPASSLASKGEVAMPPALEMRAPVHAPETHVPQTLAPGAVTARPLAPEPRSRVESAALPADSALQSSRRRAAPTQSRDDLANELGVIDSARADLSSNRARGALQKLDDYAERYPKGRLGSEARLLRIQALLALGERDAAVRLGKAALERSPNGPYARRIRSLIGEP